MTAVESMCDDPSVQRRAILIGLFCLILAIVRISGVHAHFSVDHSHDSTSSAHDAVIEVVAAEHLAGHLDSHLEHGDVDVDVAAKGYGKVSSLSLSVALVGVIVLFLAAQALLSIQLCPPPSRPPKWRRRSYLIPPSHAPPTLA